jgi:methyltransferase (TIGR00027 family)
MQFGKPSRTALATAFHRAAHQVLEQGRIFADPLALRILGADAQTIVRQAEEDPSGRHMRLFIAVRARFAEDALAVAIEGGVRQVVVLGAGLDTYAYRNPFADRLPVFEVDHPATQAWKRQRLRDAGIPLPSSLTFVPVDFEREALAERLAMAGFDRTQHTFFSWLGVVPYLNQEAVWSTLAFIASLPNGAHVVFLSAPLCLPPTGALGFGRTLRDESLTFVLEHCHDELHATTPVLNISCLSAGIDFADGASFRNVCRTLT